jgi:hypothetical protein
MPDSERLSFGERLAAAVTSGAMDAFLRGVGQGTLTIAQREAAFFWVLDHAEEVPEIFATHGADAGLVEMLRRELVPAAHAAEMPNVKVKSGDTLSSIAARHGTTVAAILADERNAFLHDDRHDGGRLIFTTDTIWLPGTAVTAEQKTIWERVSNFMSGAWGQLEETVSGWWGEKNKNVEIKESVGIGTTVDLHRLTDMQGNTLTAEQQNAIRAALTFDLDGLPGGNKAILEYLITHFLTTENSDERLQYDSALELTGRRHGTDQRECKAWLDDIVILSAAGIDISALAKDHEGDPTLGTWVSDEYQIGLLHMYSSFQEMIQDKAQIGDVIQMYGSFGANGKHFPHTMVIGNITNEGIWVFDTNFGTYGEPIAVSSGGTGIMENGQYRDLTAQEIADNRPATHIWQSDNTVRYHFMSYEMLNLKAVTGSIQRVP